MSFRNYHPNQPQPFHHPFLFATTLLSVSLLPDVVVGADNAFGTSTSSCCVGSAGWVGSRSWCLFIPPLPAFSIPNPKCMMVELVHTRFAASIVYEEGHTTKFLIQVFVRVFHFVEKVLHLLMLVLTLSYLQRIFSTLERNVI